MRFNKFKILLLLLFSIILLVSCQSDYTKLVKKELASGIKHDTILFDLSFGNTRKEFYQICWDLNKNGIATHGENNNYVKTILGLKDTLNKVKKIKLMFYARFSKKDIIRGLDMKFTYTAWAPWNKELTAEKLLPSVKDTLLKWYPGNPFLKLKQDILVKVDGNRQIQLKIASDREVSVLIEDLSYKYKKMVDY
jgi:hypothetical protein